MKRFLSIAFVLGLLGAAASARAQTTTTAPTHVFVTIDSVQRVNSGVVVLGGVLEGGSAATPVAFSSTYAQGIDSCERAALLLMGKPGMYKLEVWTRGGTISGYASTSSAFCRLSLANP